jgi:hypothetical protein
MRSWNNEYNRYGKDDAYHIKEPMHNHESVAVASANRKV